VKQTAEDLELIILISSEQWQCVHDTSHLLTDIISLSLLCW